MKKKMCIHGHNSENVDLFDLRLGRGAGRYLYFCELEAEFVSVLVRVCSSFLTRTHKKNRVYQCSSSFENSNKNLLLKVPSDLKF